MEGDGPVNGNGITSVEFQSTPSAWRETNAGTLQSAEHGISIHSLRMEGDRRTRSNPKTERISIHSLRMEGDGFPGTKRFSNDYFNPLPPHGGRLISKLLPPEVAHFNPLPPHGGRRIVLFWIAVLWHFNPLPPHGGRQSHIVRHCER